MSGGFLGKILRVNLDERTTKVQELPDELARKYVGASGIGARILYDEVPPATEPFSPKNLLIYMTGPFTGTKIPLSGRHTITTKSPLTGIFGESDVGGRWGIELRKAGFDGIKFSGKASSPTYLWVHDGEVDFRDASHVWGLDTYETDEVLRKETDQKANVSSIGPAGERLARISAIMHDGRDGRAAARCGVGAVMGSKNLKAVVAKGNGPIPVADEDRVNQLIRELGSTVVQSTKRLHDFGTSGMTVTLNELGDLPIRNWKQGKWDQGAERISGQTMAKTMLTGQYYCGACIVGCGREVKVEGGKHAGVHGAGPEYETVAMTGSLCLVDDLEAIAKVHELCNRYGLDVISTGGVIAFAMEAYERGIINREMTEGVELTWGNADALVETVEKISKREGIGWILGEGVKRAAEKFGREAEGFAIHVKGLEMPAHDPRAYNSLSVGYATANRGACHLQGFSYVFERQVTMPELGYNDIQDRFGTSGKGELVAKTQNLMSLMDSLKICKFILFGGVKMTHMLDWLNAVTGWGMSVEEFIQAGERIYNLKRMYNVRCGVTSKDDVIPQRITSHRRGEGGAAENLPPFDRLLKEYYHYRGWSDDGIPTPEKLRELGL